jgi:hypothetical protein
VGRYYTHFVLYGHDLELAKIVGYVNEPFTQSILRKNDEIITTAMVEKRISFEAFKTYLNHFHWYGFAMANTMGTTLDYNIIVPSSKVKQLKDKVIRDNQADLSAGNASTMSIVENEVITAMVKDVEDTSVGSEIYASGLGSYTNNLKNSSLMRSGVTASDDPNTVHFIASSLEEGIGKEEFALMADQAVAGTYARAVGTQIGGYMAKVMSAAFQHVQVDKHGSDCKTKLTLDVLLSEKNYKTKLYRYIVEGDKYTLLTSANYKSYIGKVVKMRTPMKCNSKDKYCSICVGELPYMLKMPRIGLLINRIGTSLLNSSLKSFHDASIKTNKINLFKSITKIS